MAILIYKEDTNCLSNNYRYCKVYSWQDYHSNLHIVDYKDYRLFYLWMILKDNIRFNKESSLKNLYNKDSCWDKMNRILNYYYYILPFSITGIYKNCKKLDNFDISFKSKFHFIKHSKHCIKDILHFRCIGYNSWDTSYILLKNAWNIPPNTLYKYRWYSLHMQVENKNRSNNK